MTESGTIQVAVGKQLWSLRCLGLASQGSGGVPTLKVLSAAGPQTTIKAFTASLHAAAKTAVTMHAMRCGDYNRKQSTVALQRDPAGYEVRRTRLGYDTWHMLAISEDTRLLPVLCQRAVAAKLRGKEFTTPLCEEWIAYVCQQFRLHNLLTKLTCFQCSAGMLLATTKHLDEVVSEGLRTGALSIPGGTA